MARRTKRRKGKGRSVIGEVLLRLRKGRDLSQEEVAAAAGMSRGYLSEIESGIQDNPSIQLVYDVVDAIGVSRDEFYAEVAVAEAAQRGRPSIKMAVPRGAVGLVHTTVQAWERAERGLRQTLLEGQPADNDAGNEEQDKEQGDQPDA